MDKIRIKGNADLKGSITIPGSKNAALPILASCLLSSKNLKLDNIANLEDIKSMLKLLKNFGVNINYKKNYLILNAAQIKNKVGDYDVVRKMRASILVLGPLLARFQKAKISLPGGCAIGTRPIDIHLDSLSKLGFNFEIENGFVTGWSNSRPKGAIIDLKFPSVGATENLILAASLADGETIINNAAKEPEIIDLSKCLNLMGAQIKGSGSECIKINGVKNLIGAEHTVMSDRIVAGTYIIAAVMMNKNFIIKNANSQYLDSLIKVLLKMNANLQIDDESIIVFPTDKLLGTNIKTAPYPGFPTDLQAQIMALMSISKGASKITENIFENRFMHVPELNRLGANIKIKNDTAIIEGGRTYKGAQVMASDLRASVSLILAGMCAEGETVVHRVYHLDRGYEKIEETLGKCGPNIIREK